MIFQRTGSAYIVRKVTSPEPWTTNSGHEMLASAGDLILSDGVSEWSITQEEFDRTYRPLVEGSYERTGEVDAVLAKAGQLVESLEGTQTAAAGDWLVTNERGLQWLVPWDHFVKNYRTVPQTGEDDPVNQNK